MSGLLPTSPTDPTSTGKIWAEITERVSNEKTTSVSLVVMLASLAASERMGFYPATLHQSLRTLIEGELARRWNITFNLPPVPVHQQILPTDAIGGLGEIDTWVLPAEAQTLQMPLSIMAVKRWMDNAELIASSSGPFIPDAVAPALMCGLISSINCNDGVAPRFQTLAAVRLFAAGKANVHQIEPAQVWEMDPLTKVSYYLRGGAETLHTIAPLILGSSRSVAERHLSTLGGMLVTLHRDFWIEAQRGTPPTDRAQINRAMSIAHLESRFAMYGVVTGNVSGSKVVRDGTLEQYVWVSHRQDSEPMSINDYLELTPAQLQRLTREVGGAAFVAYWETQTDSRIRSDSNTITAIRDLIQPVIEAETAAALTYTAPPTPYVSPN